MSYSPTSDIEAAVAAAEAFTKRVDAFTKLVRENEMSLDGISSPAVRAAVEQRINAKPANPAREFFAGQRANELKFFRDLRAAGHVFNSISQAASDHLIQHVLDTVDAGQKPDIRAALRDYGRAQGFSPEWAESVAKKVYPKKARKSLAKQRNHPVVNELREEGMMSNTHQAALRNSTYPGMADLFFGSSTMVRKQKDMRARLAALEAKLAVVEAEADRANARLNLMDAGLDWKEKARAVLAAEPTISKRDLAGRVGKSEGAVRKYWALLAHQQGCHAPARS